MKFFCFGLGYTANRLIHSLAPESWQYSGTRRSDTGLFFDGCSALQNAPAHFKNVTHILISIPPSSDFADSVYHHHLNDIMKIPTLKWLGYLSATSVYGDYNGNWVDESSNCNPTGPRGKSRQKAEQLWLSSGLPVTVFRLGGIYGPERNQIGTIKNGTAKKIIAKDHSFSRIHVDDICSALKLSMDNPGKNKIYNLVDDEPSSSADVLDFLCERLGIPYIKGLSVDSDKISEMTKSFYRDNKKVSNALAKKELGWKPKFPSYREGYEDILDKL